MLKTIFSWVIAIIVGVFAIRIFFWLISITLTVVFWLILGGLALLIALPLKSLIQNKLFK
jgi:hypothetical protein